LANHSPQRNSKFFSIMVRKMWSICQVDLSPIFLLLICLNLGQGLDIGSVRFVLLGLTGCPSALQQYICWWILNPFWFVLM
jgi:hypothetical protein